MTIINIDDIGRHARYYLSEFPYSRSRRAHIQKKINNFTLTVPHINAHIKKIKNHTKRILYFLFFIVADEKQI